MAAPKITKVDVQGFTWPVKGLTRGRAFHFDPTSTYELSGGGVRIHTDTGATGEFAGWNVPTQAVAETAKRYIGANALDRERLYQSNKASPGMAALDIALWDLAGKLAGQPVHALIGTYRTEVPAYASTIDGAVSGPLSTPESYGDFAQQCLDMGYRAFKIHPMAWPAVRDHVRAVQAIGNRVGGNMDTMLDSFNFYETFADALRVGRACDDAGFFWYEDPYAEGGTASFPHEKLRGMIRTPLLQGEKSRTVEQRFDLALRKATDFIRGDTKIHGITGTLKLAHAAETIGLDIEPHTSGPEELHVLATLRNANYYEIVWVHPIMTNTNPPIFKNMNVTGLDAIDKRGMVKVPMEPGLGVEYDWDYMAKRSTGRVTIE
jgi:L-alanine-DL-glutamate epimerase-like enolase superfamily enzyme